MNWKYLNDAFVLNVDELIVRVSKLGGRLLQCEYQGFPFLTEETSQTGSTFWTAPQSDWEWPPLPEHDEDPYEVCIQGDKLILSGKPDQKLGLSIAKIYWVENGKLNVEYQIHNHLAAPKKVAPWEISRVPPGGTTVFRASNSAKFWGDLEIDLKNEQASFTHKGEHDKKFFGSSLTGMIEHFYPEGFCLRKEFPRAHFSEAAPGEAPIEIYAAKTYVEVEQQGALKELQQGEFLSWKVVWSFKKETF